MKVKTYKIKDHKKTLVSGTKSEIIDYLCFVLNTILQDLRTLVKLLKRYLCTQVSLKESNKQVFLEINGKFPDKLPNEIKNGSC